MVQTSKITLQSCAAIVLAAGVSRRFGAEDKLAAPIDGVPMLQRVLDTVTALPLGQIILVFGDVYSKPKTLPGTVEMVHNRDYRSGMGGSIAAGAAHIDKDLDAAFIVLGDMPFVPGEMYSRLADALAPDVTIARPLSPSGPGHPVLFRRTHFGRLRELSGDMGAGTIVRAAGATLAMVDTSDAACFFDVDTPDALAIAESGRWKQT
ncbi:nucleotidyltransferase family protein [Pelagibacterium luteolum]|nr:nucleotidyltransferase family protein [Pelagibacterium luteolum]